jgi:hypothetical protein
VTEFYKFTGPNRTTHNGYVWPPVGEWAEVGKRARKPLTQSDLCTSRVLHVSDEANGLTWANVELYEVEVDESRGIVRGNDKVGVRRARLTKRIEGWNERTARLFAADCAEHVLPLFEAKYPKDKRPREAIEVARRFANGEATREELAAARDAARDAAWAAAWDAAWAAAAARDAAFIAAAAWNAWNAALQKELAWQHARLNEYLSVPPEGPS